MPLLLTLPIRSVKAYGEKTKIPLCHLIPRAHTPLPSPTLIPPPRRQSPLPSPNPSEGAPVRRRSRRGFLARALRRALTSLARAPRAPRECPLARALGDARPRVAGGCWSFGPRAEAAGAAGGAQEREWQARPAAAHARGGPCTRAWRGLAVSRSAPS